MIEDTALARWGLTFGRHGHDHAVMMKDGLSGAPRDHLAAEQRPVPLRRFGRIRHTHVYVRKSALRQGETRE